MRRIVLLMGVLVAVVSVHVAHAKTYNIAVVPWIGWSPVHVADAKGFWKEQGIDVRIVNSSDPIEIVGLFRNKRVDLAFDMIGSVVGLYMEGTPLSIIAETDWSHGGDKILVKKDFDPAAIKGKRIGVYFNKPSVTYFLNRYLSSIGLKLSDVRIVEMETDTLADHFIAGHFSLIVCYDPEALRAEREGNGKVVATSADYEGCIPEGIMALKDVLQTIPPEDLSKILAGWIKGVQWSQDPANWKEYMVILNEHTFKGDKPYSEEDLRGMLNAVRIHDAKTQLERHQDGGGLQAYLTDLKAFLAENDLLTKDFTPQELLDNGIVVETLKKAQ